MRRDLGEALVECGTANPDVVVLDADASSSTMTILFQKAFPDRFYNVGIAEAGMIDTAVGLALGGKVAFASAFAAMLANRGLEQIRTCVAYNGANVKLLAGYAGISDYKDGPTHHSVFDLAVMRAVPGMTVVVPADGNELRRVVRAAAEWKGPVYIRISRADVPAVFGRDVEVEIGRGRQMRDGTDVTLVACGVPLGRTLAAADLLAADGIGARVVEMHTLKPLDTAFLLRCARETRAIVTVEEHSVVGGLFGACAEALAGVRTVPMRAVGIRDTFACTGPDPETLLDHFGFRPGDIARAAREALADR